MAANKRSKPHKAAAKRRPKSRPRSRKATPNGAKSGKANPASLAEIARLLREVLDNQKRLLSEEKELMADESRLEDDERRLADAEGQVLVAEQRELDELKELEQLERDIRKDVHINPLLQVTSRDFIKAIIGAFFGVVGHFAFFYGTEIAEQITIGRAIILYIVSFLLAILFMYFAGFRHVDRRVWHYMPLRVGTIYLTSIMVIIFVLSVFGFITAGSHIIHIFKTVSTISILAVLGASTADLIGREE